MTAPAIVWLRRDLRLADQAAFAAAAAQGPVIPVYVLDDETPRHRCMGGASRWWLHHSLESLAADLEKRGLRLVLCRGKADEVLARLAKEAGASAVHALHHYEPWWRNAERVTAKALGEGCPLILHDGNYLAPPGSITTGSGGLYKIYTPFWRALNERMPPPPPAPAPGDLSGPARWPKSDLLADWGLLPTKPDWAGGMRAFWRPGEAGGHERLADFAERAARYEAQRNLPSVDGTSLLSPHLHFGEVSPAQAWHAVVDAGGSVGTFLGELGWRDYAQNVIRQFPEYGTASPKPGYDRLEWRKGAGAKADLAAWQQGMTGYPIVDAGMRQLWHAGWMHNRVRMIAASFLVKHLLIDWREGERWFWDTLCDADYASNAVNWQWTAGSGVDAQMFVRIMAPLTQSAKFEAAAYIREWVPEISHLDDATIHDPPSHVRRSYPQRLVDHREGRERALAAWARVKEGA